MTFKYDDTAAKNVNFNSNNPKRLIINFSMVQHNCF